MTTGIYRFEFPSGKFYIGKSVDIEKRWKQHKQDMVNGKHTQQIEAEYKVYGEPTIEIVFICHEHHLDILESITINRYRSSKYLLNTVIPTQIDNEDLKLFLETKESNVWNLSTFDYLKQWNTQLIKNMQLTEELDRLKNGSKVLELEHTITRLKNRGILDRILNTNV